jgi:hypothetical protein
MLRALFSTIVASSMVPTLVGIPLRGSEEHTAKATARVVASIFEYTRWPGPTDPVRLCVVGPAEHADAMGRFFLSDGREVVRALPRSDATRPGEAMDVCGARGGDRDDFRKRC